MTQTRRDFLRSCFQAVAVAAALSYAPRTVEKPQPVRGEVLLEAGYIYCPYIPLYTVKEFGSNSDVTIQDVCRYAASVRSTRWARVRRKLRGWFSFGKAA